MRALRFASRPHTLIQICKCVSQPPWWAQPRFRILLIRPTSDVGMFAPAGAGFPPLCPPKGERSSGVTILFLRKPLTKGNIYDIILHVATVWQALRDSRRIRNHSAGHQQRNLSFRSVILRRGFFVEVAPPERGSCPPTEKARRKAPSNRLRLAPTPWV